MSKLIRLSAAILVLVLLNTSVTQAQSTSWKGTLNTLWSNAANWTNGVPDSTKDVIIGDANFTGAFEPKVNANSSCKSINIGPSVPVTLTMTRALIVMNHFTIHNNGAVLHPSSTVTMRTGNWVNNGTYNTSATGSRVIFAGVSQSIGGSSISIFRRLVINAGSTVSLLNNVTVDSTGSVLEIFGTIDPGQSPTYTITSTIRTKINPTGRIKINTATFAGNYVLSGSVTFYAGSVAEYGSTTTDQVISSAYSYSTLLISGTGTKSLAANLPLIYGKNATQGKIQVTSGTFDLLTFTANRATTVAGGEFSVANGAIVKIGGTNNFPLNYATRSLASGSLTEYNGTDQTISGQTYGNLLISTAGIKTASSAFSAMGDLTITNGTINTAAAAVTHSIAGNFMMTGGSITGTNHTFSMIGTVDQTMNLMSPIVRLTINKPGGTVNIGSDITVSNTIQFTKGTISTGANKVIMPVAGIVSGAAQTTGWVNGNFQKTCSTGSSVSKTFEIGDVANYLPVSMLFSSISMSGDLTASVASNDHAEIDYSRINALKSVNLAWSFNNDGILFSTVDATFNWDASLMDIGVNTADFKVAAFNGTSWSLPTTVAPMPTSIQATGISNITDYAVGEKVIKTTWNGNAFTNDWFTPKNWQGGVPDTDVSTLIPAGITGGRMYPLLTSGTGTVSDLEVETTATLTIDNGTLQVAGMFTSTGGVDAMNGSIEYNGSTAQTIYSGLFASNTIKNLIISNNVSMADVDTLTGTLTIADGKTFATNDNLHLKSTAGGTARIASLPVDGSGNATAFITGAVSIERYIPARKAWRLMGVPVKASSAQNISGAWQEGAYGNSLAPNPNPGYGVHITGGTLLNGFDQSPTNSASIKYYNNSTNSFVPLPASPGTIIPISTYAGYMLYVRGDRSIDLMQGVNAAITSTTLRMKGEIITGRHTVNVNPANFTVLSNPYPSSIDFGTLVRSNVKNSFYIWDPKMGGSNGLGAYVTVSWNSGTSQYDITSAVSPVSQYIPSSEAILIESADGLNPGSITINESDKTTNGNENLFGRRSLLAKELRVNIQALNADGSTQLLDGALATFFDGHSNGVDGNDAKKLTGSAESIAFVRDSKNLSIERRKLVVANDTCFINLSQLKRQTYRMQIIASHLNTQGLVAVVKDNYSSTTNNLPVSLDGTTEFEFAVNNDAGSYAANRFSIVFVANPPIVQALSKSPVTESVVATIEKTGSSLSVYPNPVVGNTISFQLNSSEKGLYTVKLINAMGQLVAWKTINHISNASIQTFEVKGNFVPGTYQIMVEGNSKTFSTSLLKK